MRINTNLTALNTFNSYTAANNKIADSVAKLSSGYAINSAADNAAGLAISEKMRAQIRGLDKASSNSQDAISLVQTAEGSLESAGEILQRMREISVQSSSDTNEDDIDRDALQAEFSQLQSELDEIAQDSTFNNQNLLDGSLSTKKLSSGSSTSLSGSGMNVSFGNASAGKYTFGVQVVTTQEAQTASAPDAAHSSFATSTLSSNFSDATVTIGTAAGESSLLNGNYSLSASYDSSSDKITVTATGDNGQTFTKELTDDDIPALTTGSALSINFGSDSFTVSLTAADTLVAGADASTSEMSALADAIGGTFTIGGGSDGAEEQKAVMASLTGAGSVELTAGMSSVTFDNGVTVSFQELTAADLDTTVTGGTTTYTHTGTIGSVTGFASAAINVASLPNTVNLSGSATYDSGTDTLTLGAFSGTVSNVADTANGTITMSDGTNSFTITLTTASGAQAADTIGANLVSAGVSVSSSGTTTGGTYSFEDVFGTATSNVSTSSIEVKSASNNGLTIQVGANSGDELEINIDRADAEYLGVKGLDVSTRESASKAIDAVNDAINQVSSQRAYLGAIENRLDYKIDNLQTSSQNLTSAESSIRDVDMAKEMTSFTNANILSQAATAMLAQANALPQNVLSLLG
ncbi:flagellin [Papillibacter cinnamivorans]|uniref:Flagellin n=1 Tax=Papillibacter cinnamivorans DSM 12816 TaxID=1122930 RepID=A0A1W1YHF3_9FIRM|nr:flagellin [Papillibacter cinnamivorans]SMC35589.1 flagellin [Papillibacter cinnamivorans DSM 12816]